VSGSPPYFPIGTGVEGDHPQKIACRFELRGDIADYCTTAAAHLALGGFFACVFPTEQLARVETAARAAGLAIVRRRPVALREGEPPLISLFGMICAEHLPPAFRQQTWVEPELIIRRADGQVHPEYAAVKLAFGFPP
jgi:tRNA1Val (adenine37-N6)-methyltransferase